jgi:hypothetical protein
MTSKDAFSITTINGHVITEVLSYSALSHRNATLRDEFAVRNDVANSVPKVDNKMLHF